MEEKLSAIEQKIDGVAKMIDDLSGLVRGLTPMEAKKYSDDLREQFEAAEEKMRATLKLVRQLTGNDKPHAGPFSVDEAAEMLNLAPYTIRKKCNEGAIRAERKGTGAGGKGEWKIEAAEIDRYRREGDLNPPEPPLEK